MSDDLDLQDPVLRRLLSGDRSALGELFVRHREQLRRMLETRMDKRLNGRVSPSDILQEAYIDAEKRLEHYREKTDFPPGLWLRLIAGQSLVDMQRRHLGAGMRAVGRERPLDRMASGDSSAAVLAEYLAAELASPSHAAMREEAVAQLEAALQGLDPIDREILTLRHFEERGNNEVAEILGLRKQAASKRYVRALARLQEALAALPDFRSRAQ
ncbi:MAG: sigma-70 family RNA polymerase sigma factor [Pirellulales bacterium]